MHRIGTAPMIFDMVRIGISFLNMSYSLRNCIPAARPIHIKLVKGLTDTSELNIPGVQKLIVVLVALK